MRKITAWVHEVAAVAVIISTLFVLSGCTSSQSEGPAFYLTEEDIPPDQMEKQSHIDLAESPLISLNDIVSYNAQTYELKLTADAFQRIAQMEVPVRGKSFVVTVDKKTLYWGALWTPVSSQSFNGVTIWKPMDAKAPFIVTLTLGYPAPSFYKGRDPRNSPEILKSLEKASKLIDRLTIQSIEKLPRSMKGYELYSWSIDNRWHFTLITGTNRNKTTEEIVSGEDTISEAGWVRVSVTGIEEMQSVISKLPEGESLIWLASPRSDQPGAGGIQFSLPPAPDVEALKALAIEKGVEMQVATGS
jgi:hypothetical protein